MSAFYSGGVPKPIKPSQVDTAFVFIAPASTSECTEAWVLASGGINANGALQIRLVSYPENVKLSDDVEIFGSAPTLVKFQNVKVPASQPGLPQLLAVQVNNRSTAPHSDGSVRGVLLVA